MNHNTDHQEADNTMDDQALTYARRVLLTSLVIVGMGFSVLFPLLAPIGREMGLSEFQITSIIGASSLAVFLASPIWGRFSDSLGRKRVMLIGLFGFSAGTILFNSVLNLGLTGALTGSALFAALIVARLCHASVMSAAMPAATAYMADITTVENRTKGMGASGAANNLGSILGPALSGLAVFSLLLPLWLIAVLAFLNGLFIWRFLPQSPKARIKRTSKAPVLKYTDPRILPFIIVGVLMFMGFALAQQTMGFRFQDALGLSAKETARVLGLAMMLSAGASLFAQGVVVQRLQLAPFDLLRLAIPLTHYFIHDHGVVSDPIDAHPCHGAPRLRHGHGWPGLHGRAHPLRFQQRNKGRSPVSHRVAARLVSRWARSLAACSIKSIRFCPMPLLRLSISF